VPAPEQAETRYSNGGDEWMLVQLAEGMSVGVNMRALAICRRLEEQRLDGVLDICPSNASYLVRLDPDELHPRALEEGLRELEAEVGDAADFHLQTRIVDVPILWDDPWTHEVVQRFRDRHQTPDLTDIEFAAQLNGFDSTQAFRDAVFGTPFLVTMIGFVPGLTWDYQLVASDRQIEVPKYVRPRTDTPKLAFAWGGARHVRDAVLRRGAPAAGLPRPRLVLPCGRHHPLSIRRQARVRPHPGLGRGRVVHLQDR
jgi:urea carboxylase